MVECHVITRMPCDNYLLQVLKTLFLFLSTKSKEIHYLFNRGLAKRDTFHNNNHKMLTTSLSTIRQSSSDTSCDPSLNQLKEIWISDKSPDNFQVRIPLISKPVNFSYVSLNRMIPYAK